MKSYNKDLKKKPAQDITLVVSCEWQGLSLALGLCPPELKSIFKIFSLEFRYNMQKYVSTY